MRYKKICMLWQLRNHGTLNKIIQTYVSIKAYRIPFSRKHIFIIRPLPHYNYFNFFKSWGENEFLNSLFLYWGFKKIYGFLSLIFPVKHFLGTITGPPARRSGSDTTSVTSLVSHYWNPTHLSRPMSIAVVLFLPELAVALPFVSISNSSYILQE